MARRAPGGEDGPVSPGPHFSWFESRFEGFVDAPQSIPPHACRAIWPSVAAVIPILATDSLGRLASPLDSADWLG